MSSSYNLFINKYSLFSNKESVPPELMLIFRESDKKVYNQKDEEGNQETVYEYSNTVDTIIKRFNILGYNIEKIKKDFITEKEKTLKEYESNFDSEYYKGEDFLSEVLIRDKAKYEVLKKSSFDDWIDAFHEIEKKGLNVFNYEARRSKSKSYKLFDYILDKEDYYNFSKFNFPINDPLSLMRVFLEKSKLNHIIKIDISALIGGGWYEPDHKLCDSSLQTLKSSYPISEKIIILTEGSSDFHILSTSLKLLYPELQEYYYFMDFSTFNAQGGAGNLVNLIKSFASAGVGNRIVAIFDNDTAAKSALSSLRDIKKLPKNIRVLHYPDIKLGNKYPTLGPSGETKININGMACSIELYVGKDILKKEDGSFTPIQWKGYDEKIKQYQGEILQKKEILKKYNEKVSSCKSKKLILNDWLELRLIWESIFKVFD